MSSRSQSLPEHLFERVKSIRLEENSAVINVAPRMTVASDGSFVIADSREVRVRIYNPDGTIVTQFGSRGEGPGEMQMPTSAWRKSVAGALMVLDFSGLIMEFNATGEQSLMKVQSPIVPLYGGHPMSDQLLLLAGMLRGSKEPRPLLHVWNHNSDTIVHSFFPTPGDSLIRLASRNFGAAAVAIRRDTIAAIASFTDTLFLFTPDGSEVDRIPLPFTAFKRIETYDPRLSPEQLQGWLSQVNLITDVFWLDDGSFLVQYERPLGPDGADSEWGLLRTARTGDRIFEATNTPRLLAVSGDLLYFVELGSLTPNQLLSARFQR